MPYIPDSERRIDLLPTGFPRDVGELNFAITALVWDYHVVNGGRYQHINDVLGALEGAKLEFYRRVAAPYEDKKCEENGDVYV